MTGRALQDKVIFISGAAGRLGLAASRLFLDKGATVIGSDIISVDQSPKLLRLGKEFDESRFRFIAMDIGEEEHVQDTFAQIRSQFGRLDGVFHNAYKQAVKPTIDLPLEEWDEAIRVTLTSTFLVSKHAIPLMIASGGGSIVNTSSVLSQVPKKKNAAYGATKSGINQLTRVIALEYGDQGIRANALLPGDFKTEEDLAQWEPEARQAFNESFLLGRTGNPEELAELVAYLLSDAAVYVTGSLMTVDGGWSLR